MNTNTDGVSAMSAELGALLDAKVTPGTTGYSLGAMQAAHKRGYEEGVAAERERCAQVCDRVQIYHAQMAIAADEEEAADFREAEACGAEDCAEAIRMGDRWFEQPNTEGQRAGTGPTGPQS